MYLFHLCFFCLLFSVRFLQLVAIFAGIVSIIKLDLFNQHILLSKPYQEKFSGMPWDDSPVQRKWLASIMEKRVLDFVYKAVKNKPSTQWDVTILCAVLSVAMEPSNVPCDAVLTHRKDDPEVCLNVSASGRTDWKAWKGFNIDVTLPSSEVVECVVKKAYSVTQVVAVSRENAKNHYLSKLKKTEHVLVHLPRTEVQNIAEVRELRNILYHRSKAEVSDEEFTQYVESVRHLIEHALPPNISKTLALGRKVPSGGTESQSVIRDRYLADLDKAADSEFL